MSVAHFVANTAIDYFLYKRSPFANDDLRPGNPQLPSSPGTSPDDPGSIGNPLSDEIFSSWAIFILLFLLAAALWTSYYLQQHRISSVHETVLSIFYGMVVGLVIRILPGHYIQDYVTFNSSYFFNVLLPPIILNSGFELNQSNFFKNIVSILVFAIPGTFISAMVVGIILFLWTSIGLEKVGISFLEALSVGATLSATDPVTILSIFNAYKVDPKLYTIILGESLLNDAISIVMFETCQKFTNAGNSSDGSSSATGGIASFFTGVGLFMMTFTVSLAIGLAIGIIVALILKHSHIRRYPQTETCLILLFAYESYFFSNGCHMSGIVSLLFFGITLKHYAYFNMSRRSQIATKYIFQFLAQLSENFIFIYLGLSLFTEVELVYKPLLIIVSFIAICVARWCAVFPLSRLINFIYSGRSLSPLGMNNGLPASTATTNKPIEEIPEEYQMMTFWAGLRGAVGVALAMGMQGEQKSTLLATVLVVVVLTVVIFGGTTAGMLEILGIRTGCVDENDMLDDEFDIIEIGERSRTGAFSNTAPASKDRPTNRESRSNSRYTDRTGDSSISLGNLTGKSNSNDSNQKSLFRDSTDSKKTGNLSEEEYQQKADDSGNILDFDDDTESQNDLEGEIPPLAIPKSKSESKINLSKTKIFNNGASSSNSSNTWFQEFDDNILKPVLLDDAKNLSNNSHST